MSASVALVVLDSVRKDYFDEHFEWLPGIWFEHAWSTANNSIPSHGSLFGGKYPSELGVHPKSQRLDCPEPVLAEQLKAVGYKTRAYNANELIGPEYEFDRGFDEFNLRWDLSMTYPHLFPWRTELTGADGPWDYVRAGIRCLLNRESNTMASLKRAYDVFDYDDDGVEEAIDFVESVEFGSDEFLFVNLMEAHWPYWGPGSHLSYDSNPIDEQSETVLGGEIDLSDHERGYGECVEYLSSQYRRLYDNLTDSFDYVITLADHGELFGEYGAKAHFFGLHQNLTRIPVVVSNGTSHRTYRRDVVSLVDVHATICGITGVESDRRGVNILEEQQEEPRLLEFHGFDRSRRKKLLDQGFEREEIDRYDRYLTGIAMRKDYYGHETPDGFVERGEPDGKPGSELAQLLESLERRETSDESVEVSAETIERLRHFGYR